MDKMYRQPSFFEIENTREELPKINSYRQSSFCEIEEKRIEIEVKDKYYSLLILKEIIFSKTLKTPQ